jgi:hypothetical protein
VNAFAASPPSSIGSCSGSSEWSTPLSNSKISASRLAIDLEIERDHLGAKLAKEVRVLDRAS